jgi:lipopolysaccharide/colanic/teichoic acid biosynthesis glycosyltransferase
MPLYKPRPRRILDIWMLAVKRTIVALLALAAIGYFDYTYRLPRATLVLAGLVLAVVVPLWFVLIRRRPGGDGSGRTIIVGDDPDTMETIFHAAEGPVLGYVSPPSVTEAIEARSRPAPTATDGGAGLASVPNLGGISRLDEVFVEHEIDTAALAFARPDRSEFFGIIDSCYEFGVAAKVHRQHAHLVLTPEVAENDLVDVDLEPWDPQDHVVKRAFDVVFAAGGLLLLLPVIGVIGAAIKLDDGGPLFYSQERTAAFGDTFTVYKFRSMTTGAESDSGAKISAEDAGGVDPRVTRVGRFLRRSHLDEIPQLWSVLLGRMSVVGPRPERPVLDADMEIDAKQWRRRWFVKPGLTGLAQINDATGASPKEKLRYDIEYIRQQSFWFDLKIVIRQIWQVLGDTADTIRSR